MEEYELNSDRVDKNYGQANTMGKGISIIPGLELDDSEPENGLITSDSDFEQAEIDAGYDPMENKIPLKNKPMNLKKDVTKTFKKMLTSNQKRMNTPTPDP